MKKKPINAKSLQEKLESLYSGKDLSKDDDKRLLKNERASLQYQDPEFRAEWESKHQKAVDLKVQDPNWYADLVARNQALATDEDRNNAIAKTVSAQWADPAYKDWRTEIQQEVAQTQEWKSAHAQGIAKREENGWYEKRGKAYKPIHCGEYGDFPSKKAAVEAMTKSGVVNANGRLSVWLNTEKDKYFYIKD